MQKRIAAALVLLLCVPTSVQAAESTVRIPASTRYERSRIHQFTFGGGYREIWKTPIELPLLDLQHEAGGLTPTRRFGGNQTPVLAFRGKDGRSYSFRSTDKDPTRTAGTGARAAASGSRRSYARTRSA